MHVEIIGPDGKVHYTRPHDHPDVLEAFQTRGYSVRGVEEQDPLHDHRTSDERETIIARWQRQNLPVEK